MPKMGKQNKACARCHRRLPACEFHLDSRYRNGLFSYCKKCVGKLNANAQRKRRGIDFRFRLLQSSRVTSHNKGIVHTLKIADIPPLPEKCLYLGVAIDYFLDENRRSRKDHPYAPSIDRIDSRKGYIPGNVQIISDRANRMKADATPKELIAFAQGVLKIHAHKSPMLTILLRCPSPPEQ